MITEESIQEVRNISIVDVVSKYTTLKKGNKACCPIHNEKSPSFTVSPKGFFKCFGCGAGGDAIKFVELMDRLDFIGAVERIASLFNVTLKYKTGYDAEAIKEKRIELKSMRDHLQEAQQHFVQKLQAYPDAKAYLVEKRGYDEETINQWNIGFAPAEWRLLTERFKEKGLLPVASKLGLVKEPQDKQSYDVYRNRIIFPIVNEYGELLTFAGRTLEAVTEKNPKYINGHVSPLYNKSAVLFGLYQAIPAIKQHRYAILTEGYTDVISMHVAGAMNTVAACGTALTKEMCVLLKRYTNHIVIMRDSDAAGLKATMRDIEILIPEGFKVDVMELPEGQDPDDFAKQFFNGSDGKEEEEKAA